MFDKKDLITVDETPLNQRERERGEGGREKFIMLDDLKIKGERHKYRNIY